ncbi:GNAT family N-acetyltransferase [Streptomyces sp. SID2955]|nr:GNAT family N-acetyltransferase [Streptomyces sp. SID2955]
MVHQIEVPDTNDAESVGHMLLRAWLQTYPNEDAGVDDTWILEQRGSVVTAEGIGQWQQFIEEAIRHPELLFCRIVRSGAEIVGVLCGPEVVTLGPMYLLDEAQGQGTGRRLMGEFLAWADDAPMHLWVTEYNERAVQFYERHGFKLTGERELWRGKLPNVRMACDPVTQSKIV